VELKGSMMLLPTPPLGGATSCLPRVGLPNLGDRAPQGVPLQEGSIDRFDRFRRIDLGPLASYVNA